MGRQTAFALFLASGLASGALPLLAPAPLLAAEDVAASPAGSAGPAITVVAAEAREIVERLPVNGTILPRQEAAVGIDLSGMLVLELLADEGELVEKGDVLARLDRSALDTQLAQAEANRAQAEAGIEQTRAQIGEAEIGVRQAQEGYDRAKALREKGVGAQATLDNAVNSLDSARSRLLASKKALAASEAQLGVIDAQKAEIMRQIGRTEVKAPADGLVLARNATLGGIVSASGGPLFRLAIDAEMELAARVPERDLARIDSGMPASIVIAGTGAAVKAEVRRISPEIDRASRLGEIRIALPDNSRARAGNFARGEIELSRRTGIAVPASALVYRDGQASLQTVVDSTVNTAPVEVGVREGDVVEIVSGIAEGDLVVARAGTFVADGDRVTPVRADTVEEARR